MSSEIRNLIIPECWDKNYHPGPKIILHFYFQWRVTKKSKSPRQLVSGGTVPPPKECVHEHKLGKYSQNTVLSECRIKNWSIVIMIIILCSDLQNLKITVFNISWCPAPLIVPDKSFPEPIATHIHYHRLTSDDHLNIASAACANIDKPFGRYWCDVQYWHNIGTPSMIWKDYWRRHLCPRVIVLQQCYLNSWRSVEQKERWPISELIRSIKCGRSNTFIDNMGTEQMKTFRCSYTANSFYSEWQYANTLFT